jgi:hypothetical protein
MPNNNSRVRSKVLTLLVYVVVTRLYGMDIVLVAPSLFRVDVITMYPVTKLQGRQPRQGALAMQLVYFINTKTQGRCLYRALDTHDTRFLPTSCRWSLLGC